MSKKRDYIDLTLDSDDDLEFTAPLNSKKERAIESLRNDIILPTRTSPGLAGLDRAQMEKERVKRARKAMESDTNNARPIASGSGTPNNSNGNGNGNNASRIRTFSDILANDTHESTPSASLPHPNQSSSNSHQSNNGGGGCLKYPRGEIIPVSNRYRPSTPSLTFDEVLGPKSQMKTALISSYCMDAEWVMDHFQNHPGIELLMISQPPKKEGDQPAHSGVFSCPTNANIYQFFPAAGISASGKAKDFKGIFHNKLFVLVYNTFIRIVISTANAMAYDYESIDNMMYIHDFPLLPSTTISSSPHKNPTHSPLFSLPLLGLLDRLSIPAKWKNSFSLYDFSSSSQHDSARLVVSNQGDYIGWKDIEIGGGIDSLASAVESCGFKTNGQWKIECAESSVGNPSETWLIEMLAAASGIRPKTYLTQSNLIPTVLSPSRNHVNRIKILFHSLKDVNRSLGGKDGAGTMFCGLKDWYSDRFPRRLFHHNDSKRIDVLAHTKTIAAMNMGANEGFVYIGSHNFTGAAWGRITFPKNIKGHPKMEINNYEVGVLIPIKRQSMKEVEDVINQSVSYSRPVKPYSGDELPWCQFSH